MIQLHTSSALCSSIPVLKRVSKFCWTFNRHFHRFARKSKLMSKGQVHDATIALVGIESALGHVTGVYFYKRFALINPPYWIYLYCSKRIIQGSVVRRPDSAIHWIAIFSTFVKLAVDRYNLRLRFGIYKLKFIRSTVGSRSIVSQLFG